MLENKELAAHLDGLLQRLSVTTHKQKNQFAAEMGISRQQFDVLSVIYEKGQMTMGDLCKEISLACSTITDLADKLEKFGYVERLREKRDRRVVKLAILPKGEKLIKSVIDQKALILADILEMFEEEERMKAVSFLEMLTDKFERVCE